MDTKIWYCKIGEIPEDKFPYGGQDSPMRDAIREAYIKIIGKEPDFIFSGWGAKLTQEERDVVNDV